MVALGGRAVNWLVLFMFVCMDAVTRLREPLQRITAMRQGMERHGDVLTEQALTGAGRMTPEGVAATLVGERHVADAEIGAEDWERVEDVLGEHRHLSAEFAEALRLYADIELDVPEERQDPYALLKMMRILHHVSDEMLARAEAAKKAGKHVLHREIVQRVSPVRAVAAEVHDRIMAALTTRIVSEVSPRKKALRREVLNEHEAQWYGVAPEVYAAAVAHKKGRGGAPHVDIGRVYEVEGLSDASAVSLKDRQRDILQPMIERARVLKKQQAVRVPYQPYVDSCRSSFVGRPRVARAPSVVVNA